MINHKKVSFILSIMFILCAALNFVGCSKSGPIPDGDYVWCGNETSNTFALNENGQHNISYYWKINGNTAQRRVSGYVDYKGKIVEENNKIYIHGFKWKDIFSYKEMGSTTNYEVVYDEQLKTIEMIILNEE